jgi:hypothetical protein
MPPHLQMGAPAVNAVPQRRAGYWPVCKRVQDSGAGSHSTREPASEEVRPPARPATALDHLTEA